MSITVRDLLASDFGGDVYDDVCEELSVAFCGPCKLTKYGEDTFKDILDLNVDLIEDGTIAIINVDDEDGIWQKKLELANKLFYGFAGFISDEEYNQLFDTNN